MTAWPDLFELQRHVRRSKACRVLYWHAVIFNQLGHRGSRCGKKGWIVGLFCSWKLIHYFFFHTTSAFIEELSWKKSSCHRKLQWLLTPCFLQYWGWSLNETLNFTLLICRNNILMWYHQLRPKMMDHLLVNFVETVLTGVIKSVRHQAQTVDTSRMCPRSQGHRETFLKRKVFWEFLLEWPPKRTQRYTHHFKNYISCRWEHKFLSTGFGIQHFL